MLFYDYKFSKMGYARKMRVFFTSIVLFYNHKFSKMGISKILNNLFIWFFFMIINFQNWIYKGMRVFFLLETLKVVSKRTKTYYC